jgi:transcriptional regulator with XRE-family HTH domain
VSTYDKSIWEKIRDLRLRKGLTPDNFSKIVSLTPSFLSQVQRGLANPSVSSLHKIALGLDVSIGFFFNGGEDTHTPHTY